MWVWTSRQLRPSALLLIVAATLWTALPAQAQGIRREITQRSGYTDGQWALLPPWCRHTQDSPEAFRAGITWDRNPNAQQWIALMGSDFQHMHHYCRGLRYELMLNSFADLNPRERLALNERIIEEMDYVINNGQPTMPLMPEVFLMQGDAYVRLSQLPAAQVAFETSRKLKPEYWPAYTRWADVLIGLKQTDQARRVVAEGLAHMPQEPQLLERQRQLGGARAMPAVAPARTSAATPSARQAPDAAPVPPTPNAASAPPP